jgi:hypothetical protein
MMGQRDLALREAHCHSHMKLRRVAVGLGGSMLV